MLTRRFPLLVVVLFAGIVSGADAQAPVAGDRAVAPVADGAVAAHGASGGRGKVLQIGPGARDRGYLRFVVPALDGRLTKATLRLRARSARRTRLDVLVLSRARWTERGLRYRNAPRGGTRVGRVERVPRGAFTIRLDVSRLHARAGTKLDLALVARSRVTLASRETGSRGPRLLLHDTVPTVAAAGDIACAPGKAVTPTQCQQQATSDLLVGAGYDDVLALGDNQYDVGTLANFRASYDPTWGRVRAITRPVPGNHEYSGTYPPAAGATADGYFDYFDGVGVQDGPAGHRGDGWYSFDLGEWHLIALNSNCGQVRKGAATDGCAAGSPQEAWLRADLAAHPRACTLAYWHYPRFSSGNAPDSDHTEMSQFWHDLNAAGADLVLVGHQHGYERFAPMDDSGAPAANGMREIVVGSGGEDFHGFNPPDPASELINANTFGVLALALHANRYDWRFVPIAGSTFTDSGTQSCR